MHEPAYRLCIKCFGVFIIVWAFTVIFYSSGYAKDKINLELIGKWGYGGRINCVNFSQKKAIVNYAYCGTDNGLIIVDISDMKNPKEVSSLTIGQINDIALCESTNDSITYAIVAGNTKGLLYILDLSDPTKPRYVRDYLVRLAERVIINDDKAYVFAPTGLTILNISDIKEPIHISNYETTGPYGYWYPDSATIVNSFAYVANGNKGLTIIDISDPSNPVYVGVYVGEHEMGGYDCDIAISNNYAHIVVQDIGLIILDISQPSDPILLGTYGKKERGMEEGASTIAVSGNLAFIGDYNSLAVFDISDPDNPSYMGGYDAQGYVDDIIISDHYAYLIADGSLLFLDISDPIGPVHIGEITIEENIYELAIRGDYVYIAEGENGLGIMDVSDPDNLVYLRDYDTQGRAKAIAIQDNLAFVANGNKGLLILDISNRVNPAPISGYPANYYVNGYPVFPIGSFESITISGNYALTNWGRDLLIIDISNPIVPVALGSCTIPYEGGVWNSELKIAVRGNYAYIADAHGLPGGHHSEYHGLMTIDISDPANPIYIGKFNPPGSGHSIAIDNNYAYMGDGSNGLVIIDISDPKDPVHIGGYDTQGFVSDIVIKGNYALVDGGEKGFIVIDIRDPGNVVVVGQYATKGPVLDILVDGNYAYLAEYDYGIEIIDIGDPTGLFSIGAYTPPGDSRGITIKGNYAYLADGRNGLVVLDISDPSKPIYVGGYDTKGTARKPAMRGDYIYLADDSNGLVVLDTTDPGNPAFIGSYSSATTFGVYDVTLSDNYAYIAYGINDLLILDISNPHDPARIGGCTATEGYAESIAIKDNYAYIAYDSKKRGCSEGDDNDYGLVVMDVINPMNPVYVSHHSPPIYAQDIIIKDNYAYIPGRITEFVREFSNGDITYRLCESESGLVIRDISNPEDPILVGQFVSEFQGMTGIDISGDYAYVTNSEGIEVIDISDPMNPRHAGDVTTPGFAYDVTVSGDYAYVAGGPGGLLIYRIINTPPAQGNLILCPSSPASANNPLWHPSQVLSNLAFTTFINQNYSHPSIYYLTSNSYQDIDQDGLFDPLAVDDLNPTLSDLDNTITDWAYNRLNLGPLYIYFSGLGTEDAYQISPGHIIRVANPNDPNAPDSLKYYLDAFQKGTDRDLICILEFSSSGSFCDDLIAPTTEEFSRTIITCTDEGSSYLDPTGRLSFTGQLLNLLQDSIQADLSASLFSDTGISHWQRVKLLQALFSHARDAFWSLGHPFSTQPPQMVTAQGAHTLCSITLDTIPVDSTPGIINYNQSIFIKATGHYINGSYDLTDQVFYHSSDPSVLFVSPEGEAYAKPNTTYNGKAFILATIIDPNFTQSPDRDSSLPPLGGVTGSMAITVDIPTRTEKENLPLAIIIAGEREKQDYLWPEIHTITHYAYHTLLGRGYSQDRIKYLTHLKEELLLDDDPANDHKTDLNGDGDFDNDIDGIPNLSAIKAAFDWVKERGTDNLTLFLADHGLARGSGFLPSGGFYLTHPANDPDSILTPQALDLWLDNLQDQNPNLKITLIIESCHSGLFIDPLIGENRIIITSTMEGYSYLYAHGLVSFSYYLFTCLQSGANLANAFDSARQSIHEIDRFLHTNRETLIQHHQRPQLRNHALARTISLGGSFLISQDQPVIIAAELSPDPNDITLGQEIALKVRASDLDGIDKVWAMINATYSPPVFSGDLDRPIVDLPKVDLFRTSEGVGIYEGAYSGFIYSGPYTLLIFAQDTKGTVSLPYAVSLNISGQEQTGALLLAGYDPSDPGRFDGLISHAQWVLQEKRFARIKCLPAHDGTRPTLEDVYSSLNDLGQCADQLFVYLVGPTEMIDSRPAFRLNEEEILVPDTLNTWLDNFSDCSQVVLIDTPKAESFFRVSQNRIYLWSAAQDQAAYLGQGGYCAFSHFFFTCIYRGANVYQAYLSSVDALKYYSLQKPSLYDGEKGWIAHGTYLGSPFVIKTAGPRIIVPRDQTVRGHEILWAEVLEEDSNTQVWALVKGPGKRPGELEEPEVVPLSKTKGREGRYEASYVFAQPGIYEVNYYVQDTKGLLDYDGVRYSVTSGDGEEIYLEGNGCFISSSLFLF